MHGQHAPADGARKLDKGHCDLDLIPAIVQLGVDKLEYVSRRLLMNRSHRMSLAAACLSKHEHRCDATSNRCLDQRLRGAVVDTLRALLLGEDAVKRVRRVPHEHIPHVRLHPAVVYHNVCSFQTGYTIVLPLRHLMFEQRSFANADMNASLSDAGWSQPDCVSGLLLATPLSDRGAERLGMSEPGLALVLILACS